MKNAVRQPLPLSLPKQVFLLLLLASVSAVLNFGLFRNDFNWQTASEHVSELSVHAAAKLAEHTPILFVDAREQAAFEKEHIRDAVLLNETEWESQFDGFMAVWEPGQIIIVYCSSQACEASQQVAKRLRRELGVSEIYILKGGWEAWKSETGK